MATTTINTNDSKIFAAGASSNNSTYANAKTSWMCAFNFTGTQLEGALNGFFNVYIDDPTRASPIAVTPNQSNGIANTLATGLSDTSHTVEVVSTSSGSQFLASGALFRATGAAPAFASSTLYANHQPIKLGTGPLVGNSIQDAVHVRVDGGLQNNPGGQGVEVVGCGPLGYGGAITFYSNCSGIKFYTSPGAYTGPGGIFLSIDGGTPVYYSSAPYYAGDNSGRMFQFITGLDTTTVHKYELRHGWNLSGCYLTDMILVGGSGLDTTHSLPARKKLFIYGDSIANDFSTATDGSHPAPQDQYYDTTPGDRGFAAYKVAYALDLALFIYSNPSQTVTALQNPASLLSNVFGSSSNWTNADYIFLEPGINDLGSTEQSNWPANYNTLRDNTKALFTSGTAKIWCFNLFHNTVDDGGGNANLTARRGYIASSVSGAGDSRVMLANVYPVTTTSDTIDGTHLNGSGNSKVATFMQGLISPVVPAFRNLSGNSRSFNRRGSRSMV